MAVKCTFAVPGPLALWNLRTPVTEPQASTL
jgi:hypothetical protein